MTEPHVQIIFDLLQWPAMIVTVVAAWYVSSRGKERRGFGFWCFIVSNALWISWGLYAHAYAPILLQLILAGMNIRGAWKNDAI